MSYNSKITSLVNNVVFQDLNLSKNWFSSISIVSDDKLLIHSESDLPCGPGANEMQ